MACASATLPSSSRTLLSHGHALAARLVSSVTEIVGSVAEGMPSNRSKVHWYIASNTWPPPHEIKPVSASRVRLDAPPVCAFLEDRDVLLATSHIAQEDGGACERGDAAADEK
jgi:hypothetical protein